MLCFNTRYEKKDSVSLKNATNNLILRDNKSHKSQDYKYSKSFIIVI
jgi:hypothetical protein